MAKLGRWLHDLLGYPWITAMEAATLHPGDLLIFHLPPGMSPEQCATIRDEIAHRLPSTVNCCLMLGDDVRIDVVRVVDPASRPMQQRPIGA